MYSGSLDEVKKNIDLVIHMAELSNDPLGELSNGLTEEINHAATKNLLKICNETSVKKFIYMSSCAVYGKNDNLVNEMSGLSPLTNYSKSKVENEKFEINSTPTLIINNKKFSKPLTYKNIKKAIEKLI